MDINQKQKERLEQQFAFIREIDKEKFIGRQTYLTDGERKENDAEHAWHMAMMAYLLKEYANEKIDIAFLDVEMDGINGIEAGKCLRNNNKNIVLFIITSYMGYLDDAMDEGVFRYINKPLERPVIMRGLHKALLLCSKSQSKKINIEYKGDNVIIEQDSIICIESLVRKRYIKTDTQSYISLKSLSYWQSVLDEDKFFLVNKSFIVNIDRVERFTDKYIELKGIEEPIDLSREKRTAFKQKMLLYLAGQE